MVPKAAGLTVDERIAAVASRRHGLVTLEDLLAAGLSRHAVVRRAERGRLHRVHRGVYAVGHPALTLEGRWLAAVLAYGADAVLSHRSAAALWGFGPEVLSPVDVTVPVAGTGSRAQRGIRLHRSGTLVPDDVTERRSIPVTGVARTLQDLADVVTRRDLRAAVGRAQVEALLTDADVERLLAGVPGRRRVLRGAPRMTRSGLERHVLRLCARAGLPQPEVNAVVEGFEVDLLWRRDRVIVELDGTRYHRNDRGFHDDRRRDRVLLLAGYRTLRFSEEQVDEVVPTLRGLLGGGSCG